WITSSEINNQGFEIQRLNEIFQDWEVIGFVPGYGTTTENQSYTYSDNNLSAGKYSYRLKQIDFDGTYNYSEVIEVNISTPNSYSLEQNYPNPFNPATQIKFSLASDARVMLKVYNVMGEEVKTLLNELRKAGIHSINFDASDLSSGVYFYSIEAIGTNGNNFSATRKMILLK